MSSQVPARCLLRELPRKQDFRDRDQVPTRKRRHRQVPTRKRRHRTQRGSGDPLPAQRPARAARPRGQYAPRGLPPHCGGHEPAALSRPGYRAGGEQAGDGPQIRLGFQVEDHPRSPGTSRFTRPRTAPAPTTASAIFSVRAEPEAMPRIRRMTRPGPARAGPRPFLGVHLTRDVDDGVHVGSNAVLALALEGYRRRPQRNRGLSVPRSRMAGTSAVSISIPVRAKAAG